ncbi:hypothetical protein [Jiangella muralis]|uniref:hypothetical protein n=1 Tax=Jiangella muralis TaxID=702383 RepID=UPI00069D598D|nr:hypothetical protein [Jiangella muralis]
MTVTRFDGATLPAGWTAVTPAGSSVVVGGGYAELAIAPGQTMNSLFTTGTTPQGPHIWTPVGGSWDIAVALAEESITLPNQGLDLLALNSATIQGARFASFTDAQAGTFRADRMWFGFHRWGTTNTSGTRASITTTDTLGSVLYGGPTWLRLAYDQPTTTFTYSASMDGRTWYVIATAVSAVPADRFAIHATATPSGTEGRVQRIAAVVDMVGRSGDATTPPPAVTRRTIHATNFADGAVPAWLTPATAAGGTVTPATGSVTLSTDGTQLGSLAWLTAAADLPADHGMLLRYEIPVAGHTNSFWVPTIRGAATTSVAGAKTPDDKFGAGVSMLFELPARQHSTAGTVIRLLRRSPIATAASMTGTREFDGYTMLVENLAGEVSTVGGPVTWVRLEAAGDTIRGRLWYDGNPEPSTWPYQVEDHMRKGLRAAITLAHNDATNEAAASAVRLSSVELYELAEHHEGGGVAVVEAAPTGGGLSARPGGAVSVAEAVADGGGVSSRAGGGVALVDVIADGDGSSGRAGGGVSVVEVVASGGGGPYVQDPTGIEGASELVAAAVRDRMPGKLTELRARYRVGPDKLPDLAHVLAHDQVQLPIEFWPCVLVVGQDTRAITPARVTGTTESYACTYALRLFVWARGTHAAETDTARKRYTLAVRELLLTRRVLGPLAAVAPTSITESYSEVAVDDSAATIAGAYVTVDVTVEETIDHGGVGTVESIALDTGALPPHPAL